MINGEENMVKTQRVENAFSGTRQKNPGVNNTHVINENHLPTSSAQGTSGHSGPEMHHTNDQ